MSTAKAAPRINRVKEYLATTTDVYLVGVAGASVGAAVLEPTVLLEIILVGSVKTC